jgi:hypothetical protein
MLQSDIVEILAEVRDVRFGSEPDICSATRHVRSTPNSDRETGHLYLIFLFFLRSGEARSNFRGGRSPNPIACQRVRYDDNALHYGHESATCFRHFTNLFESVAGAK